MHRWSTQLSLYNAWQSSQPSTWSCCLTCLPCWLWSLQPHPPSKHHRSCYWNPTHHKLFQSRVGKQPVSRRWAQKKGLTSCTFPHTTTGYSLKGVLTSNRRVDSTYKRKWYTNADVPLRMCRQTPSLTPTKNPGEDACTKGLTASTASTIYCHQRRDPRYQPGPKLYMQRLPSSTFACRGDFVNLWSIAQLLTERELRDLVRTAREMILVMWDCK